MGIQLVELPARSKKHFVQSDALRTEKPSFSLVVRLSATCLLLLLVARALFVSPLRPPAAAPLTFDAYFRAMNGAVDLYSTSAHPLTPLFQRALRRHQTPSDCALARFLVFDLWNHGLGSIYVGASAALALACASGRVLYLAPPPEGWVHARGCPQPDATCFFQPATPCTLSADELSNATAADQSIGWLPPHAARVLRLRFARPFLAPARRNASMLADAARARLLLPPVGARARDRRAAYASARAWHTQASLYLLRLNGRLQTLARRGLTACAGGARADAFARATVGVPLRASDKCGGGGREMACVRADDVADALARLRAAQPWVAAALVTSEDAAFAREVAGRIGGEWRVRGREGDLQQGSGHPMARHGFGEREVMEAAILSMTCQTMPMYHVLAMRSNFHSLIDMLAKVVPGKAMHFSYSLGEIHHPW